MQVAGFVYLAKESAAEWSEDKVSRLAAALTFYSLLSIPSLLFIAIQIAGFAFGAEETQSRVTSEIGLLLGERAGEAVEQILGNMNQPGGTAIGTAISVALLLFGASGVFAQLQDALNTMWEVQPAPGNGIMATVVKRFFSFTMVLGVGFLLLVSLVISAAMSALGDFMLALAPAAEALMHILNFVVSLGVITLLFALLFKIVPDAEIAWRDVWIGAFVTALLFTIGKFAIGTYLGSSDPASTYGAAGSLVLVLLWVYYSSQILFFGAEFTQVYANKFGSRIVPDEDAVPMTEEARAEQGIPHKRELEEAAGRRRLQTGVAQERAPGVDSTPAGEGRQPVLYPALVHRQQKGLGYYLVATLAIAGSLLRWFRTDKTVPKPRRGRH